MRGRPSKYASAEARAAAKRVYDASYRQKYARSGPSAGHVSQRHEIPASVLQERAQRELAEARRTQTQTFCGDPPPGYSALDQKRKHVP